MNVAVRYNPFTTILSPLRGWGGDVNVAVRYNPFTYNPFTLRGWGGDMNVAVRITQHAPRNTQHASRFTPLAEPRICLFDLREIQRWYPVPHFNSAKRFDVADLMEGGQVWVVDLYVFGVSIEARILIM